MKSKNIIAAILIILMTLSVFAGCKKEEVLPTVNEDGVALLKEPVVIADTNENYFKIMMPDGHTNVLADCLSEMISPAEGFRLSYDTAAEQENGNTEKEILVGNTCREESKTAMAAIGYDDFSVTYANNKIIIAAHNPERLAEAVRFFKEKCIRSAEGRLEYIGDYTYMSTDCLMIDRGETLADYKIVIGHDKLYMSAYAIQQYIKEKHGAEPEIIYDSEPKSTNEIVLGNADRDITRLTEGLAEDEAIIAVDNKDLLISANNYATVVRAVDFFESEYLSGTYTDIFNFKADMLETHNVYKDDFKDSNKLANGADLRIMSFNVLCELYNEKPPISGRDMAVAAAIINYLPDVVGLQEMSPNWHKALENALEDSPYRTIEKKNTLESKPHQNINFSPIIYNSDTVISLDSGIEEYSVASKPFAYVMTWGYFEHKVSGEKFVVINTHLDLRNKEEPYPTNRATQATEIAAFINELKGKYDCPVITTGDYNTTEAENGYKTIINTAQMSEAKHTAHTVKRACNTYHDLGKAVSVTKANSIDHIFGSDRVEFMYFNVLVDKTIINASDHCPIYADVKLN